MSVRVWSLVIANLIVLGLGFVGFLAIGLFDKATSSHERAARQSSGRVSMSDQIQANLPALRGLELEYITTEGSGTETDLLALMDGRLDSLQTVMDHYEDEGALRTDAQCIGCHTVFARYDHSHDTMLRLSTEGRTDEAMDVYLASADQYDALLEEADRFREQQLQEAEEEIRAGVAASDAARRTLIIAFVITAVLAFAVGQGFATYTGRRLGALIEGTRRVMRGDLEHPVEVRGRDEFAELGRSFNSMTESLLDAREENVRLHGAAIQLREERIALLSDGLRRSTEAQENERKRVSRELHDGVGQALTGLQLGLGRLAKLVPSEDLRDEANSLKDLTLDTMKTVRELALDLRPSMLDEIGLAGTLSGYTRTVAKRTGIPVSFYQQGLEQRLPPELEITIFRIVQEALANMARYSDASKADVVLTLKEGTLDLVINDDGKGFDIAAVRADPKHHLGLAGMEERCRFSAGTFSLSAKPGAGTTIRCRWKLAPPDSGADSGAPQVTASGNRSAAADGSPPAPDSGTTRTTTDIQGGLVR